MAEHVARRYAASAFVFAMLFCGVAIAQNKAEKLLVGDTKVTVIAGYKGEAKLTVPAKIVVHDFDVPSEIITVDHSPASHILSNSPIARMKGDAGQEEDPPAIARKVQAAFSKTLLNDLKKTSIPSTASALGANPEEPAGTLIVRGNFTTIKQGNKTTRMMIGLGRGASDVQAHVVISLLTDNGPILLSEFKVDAASGKKPGAVETMGVGSVATSAAAGAATDGKSSVEGDTARIANAVAKEMNTIMTAQGWIASQPSSDKPQTPTQPTK
ncbi:DUF4410 domain-containing protein [Terriglobus sp. TAA 43]|uniref:DUF4410 domain-containing protein n=1 Tax=Terriglobus sp. TAA 43 TaxID=278961 RepID=UPI00068AD53A|nr:DUF4410 domain-containing protein [Terriglobus sp. TAA 43]